MNEKQYKVLCELNSILHKANECGLLDKLQSSCDSSDSINDVVDAIESFMKVNNCD